MIDWVMEAYSSDMVPWGSSWGSASATAPARTNRVRMRSPAAALDSPVRSVRHAQPSSSPCAVTGSSCAWYWVLLRPRMWKLWRAMECESVVACREGVRKC